MYQFHSVFVGDRLYVRFIKADGSLREMYCEIPDGYDKDLAKASKRSLVLDLEIGEMRTIKHDSVLSVLKIKRLNENSLLAVSGKNKPKAVVHGKTYSEYRVERAGGSLFVYKGNTRLGICYTEDQAKRMIDFAIQWKR